MVHEYHDAPVGGHLEREKTFAVISRDFFWPRMYKWIRKWIRSCEICQRVKPATSSRPHYPSPRARGDQLAWTSILDFLATPKDAPVSLYSSTVSVRCPISAEVTADESTELFIDLVLRHHGLPESIVPDRDPRITSAFWTRLFARLGTRLRLSTVAYPEPDGQTERVNRVLEDVFRSYATSSLPGAYFNLWPSSR
ncbi:unnamed protein product [Phytophthora fragariaefolia]|uniref:Unnamed protein product n=1 Tax=Phytophthora fragariaefolia TaxID=1490495 RepID=A0A9W7D9E4_9STRA|nr:unnamed protein product [Phytophthora fragariaefolia]